MLIASGLTVSFFIAGLSALRWLFGDRSDSMMKAMRTGIYAAAILIPLQIFVGDQHGLNTLEHQPAKIAAMEANWETAANVPLILIGWPDEQARENLFEITIPGAGSLILTHDWNGVVPGLNDFIGNHPPVLPLFWSFRVMVGTGVLMLVTSWLGAWFLWRRGTLPRPLALFLVPMTISGWIATLAGWYTTEIGRQPWLVTGILRTAEAVGPVPAGQVGFTLAVYLALYAVLLVVYLGVLVHLALKAAKEGDSQPLPGVRDRALAQPVQAEEGA
jgi:cytochrome d ubiquinol oxidase subunit I